MSPSDGTSGGGTRDDPVLEKRARISRLVSLGQRVGYLALAAAIVLFVVGFLTRFSGPLSAAVLVLMLVACVVLPPAIVFGYGVKAAVRHEAEERQEASQGRRRRAR